MDKQIVAAVDSELATKGLSKVDGDNADLYIGYQAGIGQEKQFTSYNSDWGYGGGWYRGGWYGGAGGMSTTTGQTSTIYVGQLALDMYDSTNHDLAWRGVVSKTLDQKAKPDKQEKNLKKAIAKAFEELSSTGEEVGLSKATGKNSVVRSRCDRPTDSPDRVHVDLDGTTDARPQIG